MAASIPAELVQAAVEVARESGRAVADVSLDVIARRAGVSRVTLYRRIGSRSALDEAVRARGVDPGGRPDVRERAVAAAAALVREGGLGALTLDGVAARAACSVPALHSQLGGREGLLAALFERYSPLPQVEHLLETPATLADGVRAIYAAAYDAVVAQPGLLQALLADALARPEGPTRRLLAERYLPRVFASVGRWLAGEVAAGRCRPLPLPLLLQLLAGPLLLHATTRDLVERVSGIAPTDREDVIEKLTAAYCRAVGLGAADGAGDAEEDR
jgi:AcrR family transcriptional regulator